MYTIAETRRLRLEMLIAQHGRLAELNDKLGLPRNDTKLARLRNANERTDRPGKVYQMGDTFARWIEDKLELERGWMDTPPGYATLNERMQQLHAVAENLQPYQVEQLITIGETLARRPGAGESEEIRQTDAGLLQESQHTAAADASKRARPRLAASASVRRGGLLDPAASKQNHDGAVHANDKQAGRRTRKGDGRGR